MGIPDADWKNQDHNALDWLILLVVTSLFAVYLYQVWSTTQPRYGVLAVLLVVWTVLYVSSYWQPVGYLLTALVAGAIGVVWFGSARIQPPLELLTLALNLLFVLLSLLLFDAEEVRSQLD